MGKVDSLRVSGCECFFTNDGRWEIRAYINGTTEKELVNDFKYPSNRKNPIFSRLEKEIREKIIENRENLLREWEVKVR